MNKCIQVLVLKELASWLWKQAVKETILIEYGLSMFRVTEDPRRGTVNLLSGPEVSEKGLPKEVTLSNR